MKAINTWNESWLRFPISSQRLIPSIRKDNSDNAARAPRILVPGSL